MSDAYDPFAALSNSATGLVDGIDFDGGATDPHQPVEVTGPAPEVDINDLSQWNHVEEIDPDAMISDAIPPPPDGVHVFKLKLVKDAWLPISSKHVKGFDDNSVGCYFWNPNSPNPRAQIPANLQTMIAIDFQMDEPGQSGNGQSERRWPNTGMDRERKTSGVDTLLRVLTGNAGAGLSNMLKIQKLHEALVAEPRIKASTHWVARLVDPQKVVNKEGVTTEKDEYPLAVVVTKDEFGNERKAPAFGIKNFPVAYNSKGEAIGHKPINECGVTGAECRTKFTLDHAAKNGKPVYYPLSTLTS